MLRCVMITFSHITMTVIFLQRTRNYSHLCMRLRMYYHIHTTCSKIKIQCFCLIIKFLVHTQDLAALWTIEDIVSFLCSPLKLTGNGVFKWCCGCYHKTNLVPSSSSSNCSGHICEYKVFSSVQFDADNRCFYNPFILKES